MHICINSNIQHNSITFCNYEVCIQTNTQACKYMCACMCVRECVYKRQREEEEEKGGKREKEKQKGVLGEGKRPV